MFLPVRRSTQTRIIPTDGEQHEFGEPQLASGVLISSSFQCSSPEWKRIMSKTRVMYIEQKTAGNRYLGDRGPAVIGEVSFSRTGTTIYFQGLAFKRIPKGGICGNHRRVDNGDEYWISGVKKRGSNRHWAGGGPVQVVTGRQSNLVR